MKLYCLFEHDDIEGYYEVNDLVGVYSTPELAEEARLRRSWPDYHVIQECELDAPVWLDSPVWLSDLDS